MMLNNRFDQQMLTRFFTTAPAAGPPPIRINDRWQRDSFHGFGFSYLYATDWQGVRQTYPELAMNAARHFWLRVPPEIRREGFKLQIGTTST